MPAQQFGGDWTNEKLERIRKYLVAYTKIFTRNSKARKLTTIYVDAFAGSGYRIDREREENQHALFPEYFDSETQEFIKGSAHIALEVEPSFNRYLFIEKDQSNVKQLEKLRTLFPTKAPHIKIVNEEANSYLKTWCEQTD